MTGQLTISRNNEKPLSQDYEQLRSLGLKYIQEFSKDVWTDYNIHDPGITILETLAYAITDLAFRTSLPMEDILSRNPGDLVKDFFTAREILPCNPVTFDDLRKKIIDVEGVENAWIDCFDDESCANPIKNPAYFIKCNPSPKSIEINAEIQEEFEARNISGLYTFTLLLEEDSVLGDLNMLNVDWEMRDNATGVRKALVRFMYPMNMEKIYPLKKNETTSVERICNGTLNDYSVSDLNKDLNTFNLDLKFGIHHVKIKNVAFQIRPVHSTDQIADLKNQMWAYISSPLHKTEVQSKIFFVFVEKVKKACSIIDEVYCMYQHIRNLCEDVVKINIVPSQEIAVCADIETENGVDLENILGQLYFKIDTFFSPPVKFYLLKELLDKGIKSEMIFDGPLLKHGFIPDEELQQKSLFSEINVSDLYNLIMQIPGVKAVKYLQVTNYYNGLPMTEGEFWQLILNKNYFTNSSLPFDVFHLNLDKLRSKITFYKGDMPITPDKTVAARIYNDLKATISKPKTGPGISVVNDILPPVGTPYNLDEYYSVQNELPDVYGVNKNGIPSGANIVHKTKIKQLKGYLLFFDQLLANYLAQLAQIKNLFAVGNTNSDTYFSQPVYDLPMDDASGNSNVYSANIPPTPVMPDTETLNFYGTGALLKDFATPDLIAATNIDEENTYINEWISFINIKKNDYIKKLEEFIQPGYDKFKRRNRFLDHLLARFAENFADYAAMMYKFTGNVLESKHKKTAEEIAVDKFNFLENYPVLSYNRGKGKLYKCCSEKNCQPPPMPEELSIDETLEYDTYSPVAVSNTTGLQKNAAAMLGMDAGNNADLVLDKFMVQPSGLKFRFVIQYDETHQLVSTGEYEITRDAFAAIESIVPLIIDENEESGNIYFEIKPFNTGFRIEIKQSTTAVLPFATSTPVYTTTEEAKTGIRSLKKIFFREGMHVVEHLLLRPLPFANKIDGDNLKSFFPLCAGLNEDCDCPETDYYSFRISIILPYWPERFRNIDFRNFAEDTIHREVPAHIIPKFCWVSMFDMNRHEQDYRNWFEENKKYKPDMSILNTLLNSLIKTLNTLTNVYPQGHLHDCTNPSTGNPVILNQTILGTF